jgi:hypothetical protein
MIISPHSQRLERWLGPELIGKLSRDMSDWYGPPIAVHGIPGNVRVCKGGDFIGKIREGWEMSALDRGEDLVRRLRRGARAATRANQAKLHTGFASLSDLISEATTGAKRREFPFVKNGPTGVVNVTSTLWRLGASPPAGAVGSAAPGGRVPDDAATGAFPFSNPSGGDTQHFVSGYPVASVAGNTLLLYDRLFDVAKTMASTSTEAVTGVPTRYTSQTAGNADYIGGNFLFIEVGGTQLAATAHNWTTCLYTDQGGSSSTMPSIAGNSAGIVDRLDMPAGYWFCPLETGDVGVKALTQMQCSASVATGVIDFVIGHPIAWMPCPVANMVCNVDGINTAFNLTRIFDDAALAFLEVCKPATTATVYSGSFTTVAG